jgi:hypothetical protein
MTRPNGKEKPQRSCLGCRETRDKDRLLRFVLSPQDEVLPDLDSRLPGRGAYTCISSRCLESALQQRQFNRAFKREVSSMPAEQLTGLVARLMRERILGCLGMANRAGKIISGGALVSDAIRGKIKPGLILVAADVSESIGEKIVVLADMHRIRCERVLTKDDFGAILGKAPRSAVAVRQGGFVVRLVSEIERFRNFLGEV